MPVPHCNPNHNGSLSEQCSNSISIGQGSSLNSQSLECVQESFCRFVASNPHGKALFFGSKSYTYEDLNKWSDLISQSLIYESVTSGSRVGIFIESSATMIAACLAALKIGATYIPLDVSLPETRLKKLLDDADVCVVMVNEDSRIENLSSDYRTIKVPEYDSSILGNVQTKLKERTTSLDHPAYIIYTSGSTGDPKGVTVSHRALAHSTRARQIIYPEKPVFLLLSPGFCDSSIAGIWGTLASGGHLIVASFDECRDPEALVRIMKEQKVTHTLCIPSLYDGILEAVQTLDCSEDFCLSTAIVAGETLHKSTLDRHFSIFENGVDLVNEYGPTEATVWATYYRFTSPETISIGRPITGSSIYILNENLEPAPKGELGEIFIGGGQLAEGYFNKPEATDKVFCKDPYSKAKNARMYRTGDLGYWNENGNLHFSGRKDHQVKIRGFRVELDAIESSLKSVTGIKEAVVAPNDDHTSLIAFIASSKNIEQEHIRDFLVNDYPPHMIPSTIIFKDQLPKTNSGKIDRKALTIDDAVSSVSSTTPSPKQKNDFIEELDTSEKVAKAWEEILDQVSVPDDINFFDLGGTL